MLQIVQAVVTVVIIIGIMGSIAAAVYRVGFAHGIAAARLDSINQTDYL